MDKDQVETTTAAQKVKWSFNPPAAPHFGGPFEIMVKAAKRALYAILGSSDVTDEELMTAMVGAESLINSRPLTTVSTDPKDATPLTPNHFVIGQLGGELAPEIDGATMHLRQRWRRVQELVRHFWNRWLCEWLPLLSTRRKWKKPQDNIRVGDIVLVLSNDTPRAQWPIGRVVDVFPGKDGLVRVTDVLVNGKMLRRPISNSVLWNLLSERLQQEAGNVSHYKSGCAFNTLTQCMHFNRS